MSIRACKKRSYGSVTKEEEFNQHNGTKEATRFLEKNLWEHHRTNILTYCEGEKIHKHQQNLDEEESSKHDTEGQRKKSEQYWGQRQNGWAGAVMVGRGGKGGQGQ